MYCILVYDICLEGKGSRVLNHVFKLCKKYLCHVQNSVFEGELTKSQLFELKIELKKLIRDDVDSVILFTSRNERWLDKELIGIQEDKTSNFL